jgi:uncharacterized surface anchored protein
MGRAQSTFGGIVGVVKDPGQGAIAGAQIVLTNIDDRTQHNATTDTNGSFEFINLKAGRYELLVRAIPGEVFCLDAIWSATRRRAW